MGPKLPQTMFSYFFVWSLLIFFWLRHGHCYEVYFANFTASSYFDCLLQGVPALVLLFIYGFIWTKALLNAIFKTLSPTLYALEEKNIACSSNFLVPAKLIFRTQLTYIKVRNFLMPEVKVELFRNIILGKSGRGLEPQKYLYCLNILSAKKYSWYYSVLRNINPFNLKTLVS